MSKIDHSELNKSYINATFSSIRHLLDDNSISEIMLNPYSLNMGQMWVVRTNGLHEKAKYPNGQEIFWDNIKTSQLFQLLSGQNEKITHSKRPTLECNIPIFNYRFTGVLQPASKISHLFCIRKFTVRELTFEDYVSQGLLSNDHATILRAWIKHNFNVLICGVMFSGKTTFENTYISEILAQNPNERIICIEDTPELTYKQGSNIAPLICSNEVGTDEHIKTSMRLTGQRIIVGEIRDKAAYSLYKVWGTGHRGGITSMHAGSFIEGMSRLEKMCLEHHECDKIDREDLARVIDGVIVINVKRTKKLNLDGSLTFDLQREISQIVEVTGYDNDYQKYTFKPILGDIPN
jgi:type IV secretion system protein TrbB